jgi:hypothetical protein
VTEQKAPRGVEQLELFLKFQPPTVYGAAEQDQQIKQWVEHMEDTFLTLQYTGTQKVKFAAFRLRGPAQNWWHYVQTDWEIT